MKKVSFEWFTSMKGRYKVITIAGGVIVLYAISNALHRYIKHRTAVNSFGNENISLAKSLYSALYPDGKPEYKFSFWNPIQNVKLVGDVFKAGADKQALMRIAGNDLTKDNFKRVASAYSKLYNSDLLYDLQERMDSDFKDFDYKVRTQSSVSPEQKKRIARNLAEKMYKDMDAYFTFSVNDDLYDQLDQMSDNDFILVYNEYQKVLDENDEEGTLRSWVDDDARTMDAYNSITDRMNKLGLK